MTYLNNKEKDLNYQYWYSFTEVVYGSLLIIIHFYSISAENFTLTEILIQNLNKIVMDKKVQKELDQLVEILDKKINNRIDTIEVQAKKSSLGFSSHRNSFKHEIQKSLKENKGSDKFEIKAGET